MSTVYVVFVCDGGVGSHFDVTTECGPPSPERSNVCPSTRTLLQSNEVAPDAEAMSSGNRNVESSSRCIEKDGGFGG